MFESGSVLTQRANSCDRDSRSFCKLCICYLQNSNCAMGIIPVFITAEGYFLDEATPWSSIIRDKSKTVFR